MAQAIAKLESDSRNPHHEFWPADIDITLSLSSIRNRILGPNQITDLQLLLLAHRHHAQLATLDAGIRELAAGTRYANSLLLL